MDYKQYDLTEEQYMIKDMVRKMAEKEIKPYLDEIDEGHIPDSVWQAFVEQGLVAMCYPEEYGGIGSSFLDIVCMQEELARVDTTCAMLSGASMLPLPLVMFGSPEQKEKYLPRLASGEQKCCFALTEPDSGSDAASIKTTAIREGDCYIVNGNKRYISFAEQSELCILICKTNPEAGTRGINALIVEMDSPGITVGKKESKMGAKGASACEVYFEDVKVPVANRIGGEGEGFRLAMQSLEKNRVGVGGIAVGLAQGSLDFAIQYAKERYQFGAPIAANQGLQWMICDMAIKVETARHLVYKAACLFDQGHPDATKLGAMAKCYATDICMEVCTDGIQVCGGAGYMKEYPQERRFREAKLLQIVEGTNQIQRVVLGRKLFGKL